MYKENVKKFTIIIILTTILVANLLPLSHAQLSQPVRPDETTLSSSVVCGFITDNQTNDTLDNATVRLTWTDAHYQYEYKITSTNSDGFYSINVDPGEIYLRISRDGYLY
jgi:hypothetical protein